MPSGCCVWLTGAPRTTGSQGVGRGDRATQCVSRSPGPLSRPRFLVFTAQSKDLEKNFGTCYFLVPQAGRRTFWDIQVLIPDRLSFRLPLLLPGQPRSPPDCPRGGPSAELRRPQERLESVAHATTLGSPGSSGSPSRKSPEGFYPEDVVTWPCLPHPPPGTCG